MNICNWLIFGSGFGLYGYLPAILKNENNKIYLPNKYKTKLINREDLNCFYERINWYDDLSEIINFIDSVVIACNPETQPLIVNDLLKVNNIKKYILEKPLAINPIKADKFLKKLIHKKTLFTCGYSFLYTNWFKNLKLKIKNNKSDYLFCDWAFQAHHLKNNLNNWKANHLLGGGPLRFYGIHLIAIFSALGYENVISSEILKNKKGIYSKWEANFESKILPPFKISIDINSIVKEKFVIYSKSQKGINNLISFKDPFDEENSQDINDKRINILDKIIKDNSYQENIKIYKNTINLWRKCEEKL